MRASCWFLCLKKSAITFGEGCIYQTTAMTSGRCDVQSKAAKWGGRSCEVLVIGSANERRRCIATSSPIGWAHTQNDPWGLNLIITGRTFRLVFIHNGTMTLLNLYGLAVITIQEYLTPAVPSILGNIKIFCIFLLFINNGVVSRNYVPWKTMTLLFCNSWCHDLTP